MEPQQCQVTALAQSLRLSEEDALQILPYIIKTIFHFLHFYIFHFYLKKRLKVFIPIYLENVGQVSQVECVVKLDSCGQETVSHLVVQADGGLNHSGSTFLNCHAEELLLYVTVEDLTENGLLSLR